MAKLSQRNNDRLSAWVARQARLRDPESFIDHVSSKTVIIQMFFAVPPALTSLVFQSLHRANTFCVTNALSKCFTLNYSTSVTIISQSDPNSARTYLPTTCIHSLKKNSLISPLRWLHLTTLFVCFATMLDATNLSAMKLCSITNSSTALFVELPAQLNDVPLLLRLI